MQWTVKKRYVANRIEWFNDNNNYDMAPFSSPDGRTLQVETPQYMAWAQSDGLDLLKGHFETIVQVDTVDRLPASITPNDVPTWYWTVYDTIISRANAHRWYQCLPGAHIVWLDPSDAKLLIDETRKDEATPIVRRLAGEIDTFIASRPMPSDGYFVKCGSCSTKKHYPPCAIFSGAEAMDHLLRASPIIQALATGRAACLLIRPFIKEITGDNEIRVFVRDGIVTGVSQQSCYEFKWLMTMMVESAAEMIRAAQTCYDLFTSVLPSRHQFGYECTFDGYFTTDGSTGDITVHLIEINSEMFGWGPAGASLFHWRHDPPPLPTDPPVFYVVDRY